jgi:hypothetical protein
VRLRLLQLFLVLVPVVASIIIALQFEELQY